MSTPDPSHTPASQSKGDAEGAAASRGAVGEDASSSMAKRKEWLASMEGRASVDTLPAYQATQSSSSAQGLASAEERRGSASHWASQAFKKLQGATGRQRSPEDEAKRQERKAEYERLGLKDKTKLGGSGFNFQS